MTNIEIIQYFLKEQISVKEVAAVIKKDDELITKEQTERDAEETAFLNDMVED